MKIMNTTTPDQYLPSTSGVSAGGICRDFIWGICSFGSQCIYRHELDFNTMKSVLKFCRDHQNRTGCTRTGCTYLHMNREEQSLFLSSGKIPRVLIDRYTHILNASTPAPPVGENATSVPLAHHMMYEHNIQLLSATMGAAIQNSPMMHSSAQGHGPIPGPIQGPVPCPIQGPIPCPMQGSIPCPVQGPIPCPVPLPASIPVQIAAPAYSSHPPPHQSSLYNNVMPQTSLPLMFDPSRPPPPIQQAVPSRLLKRRADSCEAWPSKLRKVEPKNNWTCGCCVQRQIRADVFSHQVSGLEQQVDRVRNTLKDQMDAFEKKQQILKSILKPDMYRRAVEFIQNGSPSPISLRSEVYNPSLMSSPMTACLNNTNNLVNQLLERFQGNSGFMESTSSTAFDNVGLMPIPAQARPTNGSAEILSTLLDLLRNDRECARPAGAQSLQPYANGGEAGPPRYPPPPRPFPPPPALGEPPAPAPHPHPPAARPLFTHTHFAPNNMLNPPYPGAASNQPPRPPMPPQDNPCYMEGRYPTQHYYPPYQ